MYVTFTLLIYENMKEKELLDNYSGKISELRHDENGDYKVVNGEKIYQITGNDRLNAIINSVRASGRSAFELLNE